LLSSEGVDAFGQAVLPGGPGTPVGGGRTVFKAFQNNQVCENSVAPAELLGRVLIFLSMGLAFCYASIDEAIKLYGAG